MKLAMIIDKRRCTGCLACVVACKSANGTPPGTFWTKTLHIEQGKFPNAKMEYLPLLCNHCDDAPCVKICPTGASMKMEDGTVQINTDACIGCKSCMAVCPYGARYYNPKEGAATYWFEKGEPDAFEKYRYEKDHRPNTVGKCDFCSRRREQGLPPACVATCASVARIFGDLDDPNSEVSQLYRQFNPKPYKPEAGTSPRVFYIE